MQERRNGKIQPLNFGPGHITGRRKCDKYRRAGKHVAVDIAWRHLALVTLVCLAGIS